MLQRPKVTDTEEDLLKQEEEFLKTSGKEPKWKKSNEEEKQNESPKSSRLVVGDILEKNQSSLNISTIVQPVEGFPKPFEVETSAPPAKKGRKSLFALHMEKNKAAQQVKSEMSSESLKSPKSEVEAGNRSFILTGPESDKIHEENLKILSGMSQEEILHEQEKLHETLKPEVIEMLKNLRKRKTKISEEPSIREHPVEEASKEEPPTESMDVDANTLSATCSVQIQEAKQKLSQYVDETWLNHNIDSLLEKEKLDWIGDIPDAKSLEPDQPYSARFDFKGDLQPFSSEIDVTKSLHHHGDEPERPGYTIQELYQLSRSNVLQQRILAINTLANIIRKTKLGYYDNCFDGFLLHKLVESDLFFLLRFSIDENALISASVNCLRRLLCNDTDEFCLDKLLGVDYLDEQPLICNKMEVKEDEEKELKDHVIISCDLIKGVLRTDLLLRLGYILNNLNPNRETIINIMASLIRISRHSLEAIEQIIKTPNLLNHAYLNSKSEVPIYQCVKLLRLLVSHSKEVAAEITKNYDMSFLMKCIDSEDVAGITKSEFYLLKLESVYLWRFLLHYDLMMEEFVSWTPCFVRLLRFYVEKVDASRHNDFDFELFSGISSILITCLTKKINLDSNCIIMIQVCLEKWLKQLLQLNEFNYASMKALGSCFRFLTTHYEFHGVDESNLRSIKNTNSLIKSLIESKIFRNMAANLNRHSHLLKISQVRRDPNNLPSLCSVYEGGEDYLKIVQNSSPLPFFISFTEFLNRAYQISHDYRLQIESFTEIPEIKKYFKRFCDLKGSDYNWFMKFELKLLINILELLVIKDDDDALRLDFRLLPIMRLDDKNAEKLFSIACDKKLWKSNDLNFLNEARNLYLRNFFTVDSKFTLLIPYKSDAVPKDWTFKIFLKLRNFDKTTDTINALRFIELILDRKPEILKGVSRTVRYYRLCTIFLTDSNVFDSDVLIYLRRIFEDILTNEKEVDLNLKVEKNKSFYDLYTELITQYAGLSYGEILFAQFVLFPLQNKFDVSFRKLLWFEYLHVLRVITLPFPIEGFIDVKNFTEPCETDESLLITYLNSVCNNVITKIRNPFVYNIAIKNVRNFIRSNNSNMRVYDFLMKKINSLKDEKLKNELIN